jgi:two-component system cell cycle sensor histidine kinase/response regulator CckA
MNSPLRFHSASSEILRVLLLEDSPLDEELIRRALSRLERVLVLERVETMEAFKEAIDQGGFRVILSDYSLPGFDGLTALLMVRERDPDLPFIIVTGSIPEERAIEFIRKHATDYVSKDRLATLPVVVERALREMDHARQAREAEQRARTMVESAPDAIFTIDRKGRVQGANLAAQRLVGISEEEILGKLASVYFPAAWKRQFDGTALFDPQAGTPTVDQRARELELELPSGRRIPIELSVSEFVSRKRVFRACFVRDLSERRRMEDQLRQAQKMEAMGSLAAGIAHDFNNVLAVVTGYAELVLEMLPQGSEAHQHIEQIRFAGDHAAALTRQLLAFSRRQVLEPERLAVHELVSRLAPVMQRTLGEQIRLKVVAPEGSGDVLADEAQLQQVLFNLAINARDAMPKGGSLIVEVSAVELSAAEAAGRAGMVPGRFVGISVTDTGVGIPLEVQKRIFEPFFTTKSAGRGTGIGLATVLGIVQQSNGHVWFQSQPGKGTTFQVLLPRIEEDGAEPEAPPAPAPSPIAPGGETVVLVEDDQQVRDVVTRILKSAGYRVLTFSSAREALAFLEAPAQTGEHPALLLTDLVMPGMSGDELAKLVRERIPGLRILFMSGYAADQEAARFEKLTPFHHIGKPFGAQALRDKIRRLLDEPA